MLSGLSDRRPFISAARERPINVGDSRRVVTKRRVVFFLCKENDLVGIIMSRMKRLWL